MSSEASRSEPSTELRPNGDQTASVAPDGNVGSGGASCSVASMSNASYSGTTVTITAANSLSTGENPEKVKVKVNEGAIDSEFKFTFRFIGPRGQTVVLNPFNGKVVTAW